MKGLTLIVAYVKDRLIGKEITEWQFEVDLFNCQTNYPITKRYRPDSLSRYWRWVRERQLLEKEGFEVKEIEGAYKTWKVEPIKQLMLF